MERCCNCFYANNKIPPISMTGMPIKHPSPDKLVRMPKNMRINPVALRAGFQLMAIIMAIIMAKVSDSINKAESGQCLVTLRCFLSIQANQNLKVFTGSLARNKNEPGGASHIALSHTPPEAAAIVVSRRCFISLQLSILHPSYRCVCGGGRLFLA